MRAPNHDDHAPAREAMLLPTADPRERALARTIGVTDLMARVLLTRGLDDPDRIRRYLRPGLNELHDPFAFHSMKRAVARAREAVSRGETIMIHGDYDVDGIAATVLLSKFFRLMEVDVVSYVPNRTDGYSFTEASLQAVREHGVKLCISVDNGTNAREYIRKIQDEGCDVLVTDHHGTSVDVAPAHTILNPRLPDAGYPDRDLAGVGVAFCFAKAVATSFSRGKSLSSDFKSFLLDAMTYVALGTVADVAPLRGENRTLVFHGLRALAESRNPGIRALLDSANVNHRSPDAEDIAFRIAPLLNAAGRMGHAGDALDLLMAPGYQEAQEAAKRLETHNDLRRKTERRITDEVMAEAAKMDDRIVVMAREGWHPGVLGICAARVAETMHKPTLLMAIEGDRARGSGRSAGQLHLRDALDECSEHLVSYGGHAAAVGLEMSADLVETFRTQINRDAGPRVERPAPHAPDGWAAFEELDVRSIRKLDALGPWGAGNHRPVFATREVRIVGRPTLDARGQDVRFRVAHRGTVLPARLRHSADRLEEIAAMDGQVVLTYVPRIAQWAEEGPVQLQVQALQLDTNESEPEHANQT